MRGDSRGRAKGDAAFDAREQSALIEAQTRAMRHTFLVSAMTHPNFLATVEALSAEGRSSIEHLAAGFCL